MIAVGNAITTLRDALGAHGKELDIDAMCTRFGVPVKAGKPAVEAAEPPSEKGTVGAQVDAITKLIAQVNGGQMPREVAVNILETVFDMEEQEADELLGDIGQGFEPAPTTEDAIDVEVEELEPKRIAA